MNFFCVFKFSRYIPVAFYSLYCISPSSASSCIRQHSANRLLYNSRRNKRIFRSFLRASNPFFPVLKILSYVFFVSSCYYFIAIYNRDFFALHRFFRRVTSQSSENRVFSVYYYHYAKLLFCILKNLFFIFPISLSPLRRDSF